MSEESKKEIDEATGVETVGHEWDGIKELNNPLPRWWLNIMYFLILVSVIYWVLMPAWPGRHDVTHGLRNYSERVEVTKQVEAMQNARAEKAQKLLQAASLEEIENDPELFEFASALGKITFADNCAMCHGSGGQGAIGYPNLNDDVWLWGGKIEDIRYTIAHGIRSGDPKSRNSLMPAYGKAGILQKDQINDLVNYVRSLSGMDVDAEAAARAAPLFKAQCSVCHGVDGTGNRMFGAPNLTDEEWLFGGDEESVRYTITNARNAVMPNWNERFDDATITSLAVYVHTLGGGE